MILSLLKSLFSKRDESELHEVLSQQPVLLDVRSHMEFIGGSIMGAQNIPLGDIMSAMRKLDKNQPFVVFCRSGNRSAQAVSILKKHGFKRVVNGGSRRQVENALQSNKTK